MIVDLERQWVSKAHCKGSGNDLFFADINLQKGLKTHPTKKVRAQWEAAKEVCIECPVMFACLRDSLGEVDGVWGGTDPLERMALRGKHSSEVRNLPHGPKRREYARLAHQLANTPRYGNREAQRIMGLALSLVGELVEEHEAVLEARQKAAQARLAKVVDLPLPEAEWPDAPPVDGDAWVLREGAVSRAYYLGETEDGEWFFMKALLARDESLSWFKKRDVRLMREVGRKVMHRVGETSRIYGTTISPRRSDRAKAG